MSVQWTCLSPTWLCLGHTKEQGVDQESGLPSCPALLLQPNECRILGPPGSSLGFMLEVGFHCILLRQHGPVHHLLEGRNPLPLV